MARALLFSRDPGGTNQLVGLAAWARVAAPGEIPAVEPLRALLAAGGADILARGPALDRWAAAGLPAGRFDALVDPDLAGDALDAAIGRLLAAKAPAHVVTATSDADEDRDVRLWRAARTMGARSWALLDSPANLAVRFIDGAGTWTLPDVIVAPHVSYLGPLGDLGPLAAMGAPTERIVVAADFHAFRLGRLGPLAPARRAALRADWGAAPSDLVVLFASECGREMAAIGRRQDYDEVVVAETLAAALAEGRGPDGSAIAPERIVLVIRPHPRDAAGKYDHLAARAAPRMVVSAAGESVDAVRAADLVCGVNSALLTEARLLGAPHFRLDPAGASHMECA